MTQRKSSTKQTNKQTAKPERTIGRSARKTTRLTPSAGSFITGTNIRRDESDAEIWRPAGMPAVIRSDSWRPLQRLTTADAGHSIVLMRSGNMLGAIVHTSEPADELAGKVHEICQLAADPLRFDIISAGTIRMLAKHSTTCYIGYAINPDATSDDDAVRFTFHGTMPELPPVIITAGDETPLSEPLPTVHLSGSGQTSGTLGGADTAILTRSLLDTYARLQRKAASSGFYIQPTLIRYRLLDLAGDCIMVSPPLLMAPASGFQCTGGVKAVSADSLNTLSGGALQARGFRVQVTIARTLPEPWRGMVKSVVVESTDPVDPVDTAGFCTTSVSNNGSSTEVTMHLPGIYSSASANLTRHRRLIVEQLAGSRQKWRLQGKIDLPFSHTVTRHTIPLFPEAPLQSPESYPPLRDAISYGASLAGNGRLLLADARHEAFNGHRPENFINSFNASGSWKGMITVTIPDGHGSERTAVNACSGTIFPPESFNPLLTFPDASAREMTLALTKPDGTTLKGTYALTSLPEAGLAYFLSADLKAISPDTASGALTVPTVKKRYSTDEGCVGVYDPLHLSAPATTFRASDREITAMHEAPRSRGTWDFARRKIIIFGTGGISLVTLDGTDTLRSAAMLDSRPVTDRRAVCSSSGSAGLELTAIAGTDVVKVGQSGVTTLMRHCRAAGIGHSPAHNEIWLANADGSLCRLTFHGKRAELIKAEVTDGEPASALTQWGNRMLIASRTALSDASAEVFPENGVKTELHLRHDRTLQPQRTEWVVVNLFASSVSGHLLLKGDSGSRVPQTLMRLDLSGALNRPLPLRMVAPMRLWLETSLTATVSADAEWHSPLMQ